MNLASRHQRVLALVAAARRLADATSDEGRRVRALLVEHSALSPEGIELVLREHLETSPSPREIALLVASTSLAPRVHVALSAHVFAGALRALSIAAASSDQVWIRASRREPTFALGLIEAIREPAVRQSLHLTDALAADPGDEVHIYGRTESIRAIARGLQPGVWVRAHGTGIGLAVVGGRQEPGETASLLARDTVVFDQRGCLSPRVVLVSGGPSRAEKWAHATLQQLAVWSRRVPLGQLSDDELAARTRFRDTIALVGSVEEGEGGLVAVMEGGSAPPPLPPPGRNLLFVSCARPSDGVSVAEGWAGHVAALGIAGVGTDPLVQAVRARVPHARLSRVGWMQRPAFDGPVDRRHPDRMSAQAASQLA